MSQAEYIDSGDFFTGTAGADLASGDIVFDAQDRAGIITAQSGFVSGQKYKAQATGRVKMAAKSSDTWVAGALVYWDATAKELTSTSVGNKVAGRADAAKTGGQTTNIILLNHPGKSFT